MSEEKVKAELVKLGYLKPDSLTPINSLLLSELVNISESTAYDARMRSLLRDTLKHIAYLDSLIPPDNPCVGCGKESDGMKLHGVHFCLSCVRAGGDTIWTTLQRAFPDGSSLHTF